jgi:glycosyltransferase involved in cell wall biosynthesis
LIRERDCRVIFATAPAFTAFPLAALLSVVGRRPLVLDYRDPWGENGALFGDRRWKQRLNRLMERLCLRRSSRVVFATEGFRDLYARRHPDLAERFEVIQNGFDREPVAAKKPRGEREPLRIGYAGKMFGDQYPMEPFFRALASFVEERGRDLLRVEMAGQIDPENEALLAELGLGDVVELRGFQPREEVEQLQERSDVLLLVIGDMHPFFHGLESAKLFEYMPLARPILGLVPEGGAAWQLISRHQIGPLAPPSDVVRIRRVLDELVGRSASGPAVAPRQFHRRNLTGRLAGILDEVSRP